MQTVPFRAGMLQLCLPTPTSWNPSISAGQPQGVEGMNMFGVPRMPVFVMTRRRIPWEEQPAAGASSARMLPMIRITVVAVAMPVDMAWAAVEEGVWISITINTIVVAVIKSAPDTRGAHLECVIIVVDIVAVAMAVDMVWVAVEESVWIYITIETTVVAVINSVPDTRSVGLECVIMAVAIKSQLPPLLRHALHRYYF